VPADVVALAQWTAEYYAAGVGDAIPMLLPPMARGGRADAHKTTRVAAITAAGLEALNAKLTDKQREALELLAGTPTGIGTPALAARGIAADAISRLARHGYISLRHDRVERDPWAGAAGAVPKVPGTCVARATHVPGTFDDDAGTRSRSCTASRAAARPRSTSACRPPSGPPDEPCSCSCPRSP
jgi:hypothetical protein